MTIHKSLIAALKYYYAIHNIVHQSWIYFSKGLSGCRSSRLWTRAKNYMDMKVTNPLSIRKSHVNRATLYSRTNGNIYGK